MMTLFDKMGKGSEELSRLTGSWYASEPYPSIQSEVNFAIDELCEIVGEEVVAAAEKAYLDGVDSDLVAAVRMPVACLAVMRHASLSVVSHEATGRKVKMDENEKMPFEWMVDRDDLAMRERFYRAMDSLYYFLDKSQMPEWLASGKVRDTEESVVKTVREFEAVYPLDGSRYAFHLFLPLVIEAQREELEPFVGEAWVSVADGTADEKLIRLVRKAAVLSAVITAGERWSLAAFPLSIARRYSPTYQGNRASNAATTDEIDWYLNRLKAQKSDALTDIREVLSPGSAAKANLLPKNDRRNKYFTTV